MFTTLLVFLGLVLSVVVAFKYSGVASTLKRTSHVAKLENKIVSSSKLMATKESKIGASSNKLCMNPSAKGALCDSALCQLTGTCMKGKTLSEKSLEW